VKFTRDRVTRACTESTEIVGNGFSSTEVEQLVTTYEIVVRGEGGPAVCAVFDDLVVTARDGRTTMCGDLPDQAALYGVLARVQDLGLDLVEVHQLDRDAPRRPPSW
jgi:hypothetical protein